MHGFIERGDLLHRGAELDYDYRVTYFWWVRWVSAKQPSDALCERMNLEFFDSDQEIAATGADIPVFLTLRRAGFRHREVKMINLLSA